MECVAENDACNLCMRTTCMANRGPLQPAWQVGSCVIPHMKGADTLDSHTEPTLVAGGAHALWNCLEGVGWGIGIDHAPPAILQPDNFLLENQQNYYSEEGIARLEVGHRPIAQAISVRVFSHFYSSGILATQGTFTRNVNPIPVVASSRHGRHIDSTRHSRRSVDPGFSRALMGTGAADQLSKRSRR